MVLGKETKTKAYFSRYQVKRTRRRAGLTDYRQRKKLIIQAKNKYATPKHRLIVRFSNTTVTCQIAYSTILGDHIIAQANSQELKRYGLNVGLKNYPATYCTGLLLGRRVLKKLGLDQKYTGVGDDPEDEVTGEIMEIEFGKRKYFVDELDESNRPFRVFLDVGLKRTSLGSKVFAALKGASDAGLDIPHNPKKFPGYDVESKKYNAEAHKEIIFGSNIAEYMRTLIEDDSASNTNNFEKLFSQYKKNGIGPDDLEELYLKVHKAIRTDPSPAHDKTVKERNAGKKFDKKYQRTQRLSKEERQARIDAKLKLIAEQQDESDDEDEDSE